MEAPSPRKYNLGLLESCSSTLPKGGIITGGLYIAMIASGQMHEYFMPGLRVHSSS